MIRLARIFQDNMTLQRGKPVRLWGTSNCTQDIRVTWNGREIQKTSIQEGEFEVILPAMEAAEDGELCIFGGCGDGLVLKHVDVGEVWIAGGQSNMEFPLAADREAEEMISTAGDPHFRYYEVGKYCFDGEEEEQLKDGSNWNRWLDYRPEHAAGFSAAGVYFAERLRKDLGIPVAVVGCNWGGTPAAAWIEEEEIRRDSSLAGFAEEYDRAVSRLNMEKYLASNRNMRKHAGSPRVAEQVNRQLREESLEPPSFFTRLIAKWYGRLGGTGPHDEKRPGGLYHTMVERIAGYSCRGVIWYQGEADEAYAQIYGRLFTGVIRSWRKAWGEELPFLFVQLAPFEAWQGCKGTNFPELRLQQQRVEDTVGNCYMVSIMDAGSRYDIHPKEKRPVGERLALLALGKIYGQDISCQPPGLERADWRKGEICLQFTQTGGGLKAQDEEELEKLFYVELDGKPVSCTLRIDGERIWLTPKTDAVRIKDGNMQFKKIRIEFACVPYCRMPLYGKNGLPARPFSAEAAQ